MGKSDTKKTRKKKPEQRKNKPEQKKIRQEQRKNLHELHSRKRWTYPKALFILIPVVAFIVRVVYLWQVRHAPEFSLLVGDSVTYDAWAERIANGDWLGNSVFYQAPLYPYFLGVLYALFGRDLLIVRLIQIILGAISCLLLARAGYSFFNRSSTGLLAGALLAVYPTAIFFDCSIQKSVLDLFFVCALLAVLGKLLERSHNRWWLAAGLILGLLALTRENALLFLPIVLVWLFIAWGGELWKTRLQWAGVLLLGLAAVLLPVGFRNLVVGGEFHLTTAQFGPNFYIGNNKAATGFYEPLKVGHGHAMFERNDATILAEEATGRKLTPSEVSNYWAVKALDEIRSDVFRWLRLVFKKWLLAWNISEVGDSDDQYTYGDWSPLLGVLNRLLHFGILCPLAALGLCLTWNRRKRLWLLYAMILGYAGSVALFYAFSRYRFPLVPMLIVFAAAGLTFLRDALREARRPALWAGVATAVAAAAICNHPMMSEALIRTGTHNNLGNAFAMERKFQDAIGQFEQALRLNPNDVNVPVNMANALLYAGRFEEAIGYYEKALRIDPDNPYAHYNLGVALVNTGRPARAIEYFEQALRINPDYAEAHVILGSVLYDQGKAPEAIEHWEKALKINPSFVEAHYNLANAFLQGGRLEDAIEHYEQALKINPTYAEAHCNLGIALEKAGRLQAAIEHYEEAVLLRPDLAEVQKQLALLRAKLEKQGTR
jgi:tetratricopeptide (TPR) repeat protein